MQKEKILNIDERSPIIFSVIIVICYAVYTFLSPDNQVFVYFALALAADHGQVMIPDRPIGSVPTLFTHVFLHANWTHVLMNAGMIFAFGTISIRGVKRRFEPVIGRIDRGALVFLLFVFFGAVSGGLLQWLVWTLADETGIAVGASTAGTALFAALAWALGGAPRLLLFGIIVVAFDFISLSTQGIASGLGNPAWAGHLGGYLAGCALAPVFIKPASVGLGTSFKS